MILSKLVINDFFSGTILIMTVHMLGTRDGESLMSTLSASQPLDVFCRMTPTGGFTVIQRRMDGSVNVDRTWNGYKIGFGPL